MLSSSGIRSRVPWRRDRKSIDLSIRPQRPIRVGLREMIDLD